MDISKAAAGTGTGVEATGSLRDRLIDRAIEILEAGGRDALTLRSTARAAGVSHMAPYRHFADKDALLAAVAAAGFRSLELSLRSASAGEGTPKARLRAIGQAYIGFSQRRPALYRLMFGPPVGDGIASSELGAASDAAFGCCLDAVAALDAYRGHAEKGNIRPRAIAIWALVHGLASLLIDGRISLSDGEQDGPTSIERVLGVLGPIFD